MEWIVNKIGKPVSRSGPPGIKRPHTHHTSEQTPYITLLNVRGGLIQGVSPIYMFKLASSFSFGTFPSRMRSLVMSSIIKHG